MKRKVMLFGVVLILGLLALGCGNPAGGGGDINLTGTTWTWGYTEIAFTTTSDWQQTSSGGMEYRGTYTVSNNAITFTVTGQRNNSSAVWADAALEWMATVAGRWIVKEGNIFEQQGAGPVQGPFTGAWSGVHEGRATVLLFTADMGEWLMIDTAGLGNRGTYTYVDHNTAVTLKMTNYTNDFGATWPSGSDTLNGTVSGQYSNTITFQQMGGVTFTK